jgi:hypothetical protein
VPLGNCSSESLTFPKTPWLFPFLNPRSLLAGIVAVGIKSGGMAYRRRERSGGGLGEVRELLAVMSRGGSPAVMAGVGLAACAGVGLIGDACSGLLTAVEFNQIARGASLEVSGVVGAKNQRVAHRVARSTCDSGRMKSGDVNPTPPAMWCLVRGVGELRLALGRLAEGLDGVEEGWSG